MAAFRLAPRPSADGLASRVLLATGIVAAMWLGRDVLAPLALALLLTIAALPAADWLERRGLPRVPAVLLVLLVVVGAMGGLAAVVLGQALSLATELPRYEAVLREKLVSLSQGSGPIEGLVQLGNRLREVVEPAPATTGPTVMVAPVESPLAALAEAAKLVIAPIATLAITLLLMAFILVQREDVRDRVVRLAGLAEMHRTTKAMSDATDRLGRFLLMQVAVNAVFGIAMGVGLWAIGLPNAPLWGALGFALRFVPYLGAPLSALFPLLIAGATTSGWGTVILVAVLFLAVDGIVSFVIEPLLYGASTGIAPLALLLGSAFWALLWGPIGLILAPALTACLGILGRHLPGFGFLEVLLGDAPPLAAPDRFYQRLLAGDAEGAGRVLDVAATEATTESAVATLVLPAAERISGDRPDAEAGPAMTLRAARSLLGAVAALPDTAAAPAEVVVVPLTGVLDRAVAVAIAAALTEAGHPASLPQPGPRRFALAVVVAAVEAPAHRVGRGIAEARQAAPALLLFPTTAAATRGLDRAGTAEPRVEDLEALLAAVGTALETEAPLRAA